MKKAIYFFLLLLFICASCSNKKSRFSKIDLSKSTVEPVKIKRFDIDFSAVDTNNVGPSLEKLHEKYGYYYDFYMARIFRIPPFFPDSTRNEIVYLFLTDPAFLEVYSDCKAEFKDMSDIEKELTTAFRYANYYFPEIKIPDVYAHVSGFGAQIAIDNDSAILSISLDLYLGSDYENYRQVPILYDYLIANFRREKIVPDAIYGWLMTEFDMQAENPTLLDYMIHRSKLMYLTEVFLPKETEENLIGYTKEQLEWCRANEKKMWESIAEEKHLFSTDESYVIKKYIGPAASTYFFPREAPGRTGAWIGWQIIRSYIDKNKEVTLRELMDNHDSQSILEKSGYRP
jgi:hypothetical protein